MKIKTAENFFHNLSVFLCFFVLMSTVMMSAFTVKGELNANDISKRLIRLHVIADSDSDADQNLKLKVRNAVLEQASVVFDGCTNVEQAKVLCAESLSALEKTAQSVIDSSGCAYKAKVEFGEEKYPVRHYENFTLPSGKYLSLRIIIGKGKGKNWWCVLYPPLCTSYATKTVHTDEKLLSEYGFNKNEITILEDGYAENGKIVLKSYFYEKLFK